MHNTHSKTPVPSQYTGNTSQYKSKMHERKLKTMSLNYLLNKGNIKSDGVVINEFTIDNYSRRVDLAIISNGNFIAVEIKSDADSLDRLTGQTDKYLEYFDKVIVFVGESHLQNAILALPANVEIWSTDGDKIKISKRGIKKKIKEKTKYLDLLKKSEMINLSKKIGIQCKKTTKSSIKKELNLQLKGVAASRIKEATLEIIRNRFKQTFDLFLNSTKKGHIESDAIDLLSPYLHARHRNIKPRIEKALAIKPAIIQENEDPLLAELAKKSKEPIFGPVPECIKIIIKD